VARLGRPPIPAELHALIRRITNENPSWGEERIANGLLLKIGVRVSPRTVNKARCHWSGRTPTSWQRGDIGYAHDQNFEGSILLLAAPSQVRSIGEAILHQIQEFSATLGDLIRIGCHQNLHRNPTSTACTA
jgi:hypothetical protein